ncbi:hypothetical protein [Nocardiopsis synnemataformans]
MPLPLSPIRHVFDTVGAWGGLRLGLWVGAAPTAALLADVYALEDPRA